MKNLNIHWKPVALCIFAVILTIWAGSGMKQRPNRTPMPKPLVSVREAAIGALGQIGVICAICGRFDC